MIPFNPLDCTGFKSNKYNNSYFVEFLFDILTHYPFSSTFLVIN